MAIVTKDELIKKIKDYAGEDTGDAVIELMEDVTDTFDSFAGDGEDWKTKYEELDKTWREKYTARFVDGTNKTPTGEDVDGDTHEEQNEEEITTYEDFFKSAEV